MNMFGNDPVETGIEEAAAHLAATSKGARPAPDASSGQSSAGAERIGLDADDADHDIGGTLRAAESYTRARGERSMSTANATMESQAPPTFIQPNFDRMPPELKMLNNLGALGCGLEWHKMDQTADPDFGLWGEYNQP